MARVPVVKTKHLVKNYKLGNVTVQALRDINVEIYAGEYVIFFGPSGCGKTTLLNMIAGLDYPTSGDVLIRGESLASKSVEELARYRRQKIGMVFQEFNLIRTMNVVENIALPLAFAGVPRRIRLERAKKLLQRLKFNIDYNHTPADLSGGQQQRVAIARALAANPWVLLFDEPTGNLDSKSARDVMRVINNLAKKSRRTILMVTHNPDYLRYANRVFYMKDGKITKIRVNRGRAVKAARKEIPTKKKTSKKSSKKRKATTKTTQKKKKSSRSTTKAS